jgi:hypothetical protein
MTDMPDAVIEDPWQARMDRMRRLLPMPLLLVSTSLAAVVAATQHTWARFELSLPVVAAAALWWATVTVRLGPGGSTRWRLTAFGAPERSFWTVR